MTASITLISVEYSELSSNIRTTWQYISSLLVLWVVFQVFILIITLALMYLLDEKLVLLSKDKIFYSQVIFAVLAFALSVGAAMQNSRLFNSAKHFINRAKLIEQHKSFLFFEEGGVYPQYTYMSRNLYGGEPRTNLHAALTVLYTVVAFGWITLILKYYYKIDTIIYKWITI